MQRVIAQLNRLPRPVLMGGVLVLLMSIWCFKPGSAPAGAEASAVSQVNTGGGLGRASRASSEVRVRLRSRLHRDPFSSPLVFPPAIAKPDKQPEPQPAAPEPDPQQVALELVRRSIRLSAIVMTQHPVAVINGTAYQAGDTVEGFRLRTISPRSVVLERDGAKVLVSVQ